MQTILPEEVANICVKAHKGEEALERARKKRLGKPTERGVVTQQEFDVRLLFSDADRLINMASMTFMATLKNACGVTGNASETRREIEKLEKDMNNIRAKLEKQEDKSAISRELFYIYLREQQKILDIIYSVIDSAKNQWYKEMESPRYLPPIKMSVIDAIKNLEISSALVTGVTDWKKKKATIELSKKIRREEVMLMFSGTKFQEFVSTIVVENCVCMKQILSLIEINVEEEGEVEEGEVEEIEQFVEEKRIELACEVFESAMKLREKISEMGLTEHEFDLVVGCSHEQRVLLKKHLVKAGIEYSGSTIEPTPLPYAQQRNIQRASINDTLHIRKGIPVHGEDENSKNARILKRIEDMPEKIEVGYE